MRKKVIQQFLASSYWTQQRINDNCLFYASHPTDLLSKVAATQLPNQVTGSSDYLTVTGVGLDARYRTPNTADYKTADSDYVFWKTDASESTCDGNRLIGYDFPRILVKYLNVAPYTILAIAILNPGVTVTNGMRDAFDLNHWWDNTLSFHGATKQNKPLAGEYVWSAESVLPDHDWLGRWDLNGNTSDTSGNSPAKDFTNNGNNAVLCPDRNALADSAYEFNGTNAGMERVAIPIPNNIFTLFLRFKADAVDNYRILFGDLDAAAYAQGYAVLLITGNIRFYVGEWNDVGPAKNHIDIAFSDTTSWHYIVAKYSKAAGKMYLRLDGGAWQEANVDYTIVNTSSIMGGKVGVAVSLFDGKIDQVYFYNALLTDEEITSIVNSTI